MAGNRFGVVTAKSVKIDQAWHIERSTNDLTIKDLLNSNVIPVTIKTAAPANSLFIGTSGVGVGNGDPTSKLTVGSVTSGAVTTTTSPVHIMSGDGVVSSILLDTFGTSNQIAGRRAQGTNSSKTALVDTAIMLRLQGFGYGSTGYSSGASGVIDILANGTWTDTSWPSAIKFMTTPAGSTTGVERMRIGADGSVSIGGTGVKPLNVFSNQEWSIAQRTALNTVSNRPTILQQRSLGTDVNSPATVTSGTYLGGLSMSGYDSSAWGLGYDGGVEIIAVANQTWTPSARGAYLSILTTPTSTVAPIESVRVEANGTLRITPNQNTAALYFGNGGQNITSSFSTNSILTLSSATSQMFLATSSLAQQVGFRSSSITTLTYSKNTNSGSSAAAYFIAETVNNYQVAISAYNDGTSTGRIMASDPTNLFFIGANGGTMVGINANPGLHSFYPTADNLRSLGTSSFRWSVVYAVNGTIQTSDIRQKTDVASSSLGLEFINDLRPVSYRWVSGEPIEEFNEIGDSKIVGHKPGKRTHYGLIAQEVKAVLDKHGLDGEAFAGWGLSDKKDPNSIQQISYGEFIAPMIRAIQELKAELDSLKTVNLSAKKQKAKLS